MHSVHVVDLLVERRVPEGRLAHIALIDGERHWSYAELRVATNHVAMWLISKGISPGDRVAILVEDGLEFVAAWLGAMRAGGVAVLVNPSLPAEYYPSLFEKCDPRFALMSPDVDARTNACVDPVWGNRSRMIVRAEALMGEMSWISEWPVARADDPAFALFTSGTTGAPSCVLHRHRDIDVTNTNYGNEVLGLCPDDITFTASPLFFAYGLNSVHLALYHGATAVLPPKNKRPGDVLEWIARFRPTIFFAVPTIYRMLLGHPEADSLDSLRLCVSAGERLPIQVFDAWRARYGHQILDGIGTSEVLSTFISNRPGDLREGSTGRVVRGFDVRLMTDALEDAGPDQEGVLWVRGATVCDGYFNSPEKSGERFPDGWFVTNDVFRRDSDGYYYNVGRADELAKVGGQWVATANIEEILSSHPGIHDCSVVNYTDEWGLTRPHAFVVLRAGADASLDWQKELKNLCRQRLTGGAYPHFVIVVEALPRTHTGKVQRFKLRESIAARGRESSIPT